jgi:hypothetical protein
LSLLVKKARYAFILTLRSAKNQGSREQVLEEQSGSSTRRSSEICKIDYFLIARNLKMMLYLQRSQINVPKRPPVGKTLPALKLQQKVCSKTRNEAFFERAWHCKQVYDF